MKEAYNSYKDPFYTEDPKRLKGRQRQLAMNRLSKKPNLRTANQFNKYC